MGYSRNHRLTTTKYLSTFIGFSITARITLSTRELVKFYCDVITRSRLQFINTSIDTFFSELRAFLADQRRTRKANDGKRKLDGAVNESSADRKIRKSGATVH